MEENRQRYYRFSTYLKERFGRRVYKVSIDAGFSCPNKDGRLSNKGCIFCDNHAFSYNSRTDKPKPIMTQIEEGIENAKRRFKAEKFIVYFQAYTNTYAPLHILRKRYNVVKKFKDVVSIAIGTRPDFVNDEILELIESYSKDYEVWLEYGLQSIHNKTLKLINRNHTYQDFLKAYNLTKKRNIKVCAHVIIGLPEEGRNEIIETAKEMARLKLDGIKIHPLHIVKGTKLEELYNKGRYKPLELEEYINLLVEFLKYLWPDTVIQRVSADCPKELLIAPEWILDKNRFLGLLDNKLKEEDIYQGRLYKESN